MALLVALCAFGVEPALAQAAPPAVTVPLVPENGFKLPGTATLVATAGTSPGTSVTVLINGFFIPEDSYPAGIYAGTCRAFAAGTRVALVPLSSGKSVSTLPGISLASLLAVPHVVAVHSAHDPAKTISCGRIRRIR